MKKILLVFFWAVILTTSYPAWEIRLTETRHHRRSAMNINSEGFAIVDSINWVTTSQVIFQSGNHYFTGKVNDTLAFLPDSVYGIYMERDFMDWQKPIPRVWSIRERRELLQEALWRETIYSGVMNLESKQNQKEQSLFNIEIPMNLPANIFGSDKVSLQLRGNRQISFEGRSENRTGVVTSDYYNQNQNFSINMDQRYDFSITGKIGTKINVDIHQNSEISSSLQNNIKINFRGDENDLIQEIDGGNTSLSLPSTQFVGFSAGSQGLFGIRTKMQLGDLQLITIAAQEKSDNEKQSFDVGGPSGAAQANTVNVEDYISRTYFFIDTLYFLNFPYPPTENDQVDPNSLTLYVDDYNNMNNQTAVRCSAYYDYSNGKSDDREKHEGYFTIIDKSDYQFDPNTGVISLKNGLDRSHVLGVTYATKGGRKIGDYDREFIIDSSYAYKLKLIAPTQSKMVYDSVLFTTWDYELRNTYRIGQGRLENIRIKDSKKNVNDLPDKQDGVEPFVYITGIAASASDKTKYTQDEGYWLINLTVGLLRFPDIYPFAPELNRKVIGMRAKINTVFNLERGDLILDTAYQYPDLYTNFPITQDIRETIILKIEYEGTATRQRVVNLGKTNIASATITLGNERLEEGKDYQLIGEIGQITFINDKVLNRVNEKLTIEYEFEPFFKTGQTTLFGTRAEYGIGENLKFGGTVVYRSERVIDKKPRLGSEPARNAVFDLDVAYRYQPEFLTKAVNLLPFFYSDAPSSFTVQAEIGHSMPDHNVSKYKAAYIDDFESSRQADGLGTFRYNWQKSSYPLETTGIKRGKLIWFTYPTPTSSRSVWPNKDVRQQDDPIYPLELILIPDSTDILPSQTWGGIMRPIWNPDHSRSKYIEVWLKGDEGVDLYIDLGIISEDVDNDGGFLRTEDKDLNGVLTTEAEDTGLWSDSTDLWFDPYDNWSQWESDRNYNNTDQLKYINGTKNNKNDQNSGQSPDTEDMNRNSVLDTENKYFQYHFRITRPDPLNPGYYIPGTQSDSSSNPWRLYRIPIEDYTRKVGNASLAKIEAVRLWVSGADQMKHVRIAKIEIVENRWIDNKIQKSNLKVLPDSAYLPIVDTTHEKFRVSVVSVYENADYVIPPGIEQIRDNQYDYLQNEQSLALILENLEYGHETSVRQIATQPYNFTMYQNLEIFIHGPLFSPDSMFFFIRLGSDENNYYQYHKLIANDWEKVIIPLQELMFFKKDSLLFLEQLIERSKADSSFILSPTDSMRYAHPEFYLDRFYIKGKPTLNNVRRIDIGVVNANPSKQAIGRGEEAQVWFNEMRLTNPYNQSGTAKRITVQTSLSNLGSVSYNLSEQDAFFHDLRNDFGSNRFTVQNSYSAQLDFGRFFPQKAQIAIPVNFTQSNSSDIPRIIPGSDIILSDNKNEIENDPDMEIYKGTTSNSTFSVSYNKGASSTNPLIGLLFERIKLSYSKGESDRVDYTTVINRSSNSTARFSLDLKPKKTPTWAIFKWTKPIPIVNSMMQNAQFTILPNQFDLSLDYSETDSEVQRRFEQEATSRISRFLDGRFNFGLSLFNSLPFRYSLTLKRDMKFQPLSWPGIQQGKLGYELNRAHQYSLNMQPKIFSWLSPSANYNYNYTQNRIEKNVTTQTTTDQTNEAINLNLSRNYRFSLNYNLLLMMDTGARKLKMEAAPVWKFFRSLIFNRLGAITYSVDRTLSYTFAQSYVEPGLKYQLGFGQDIRPDLFLYTDSAAIAQYTTRDAQSQADGWSLSTSLNLTSFMRGNISYKNSVASSISGSRNNGERTSNTLGWGGNLSNFAQKIPILKTYVPNLAINHAGSYTEQIQENQNSNTLAFSPLASFSTNIKKIALSYTYNNSLTTTDNKNGSITKNENNGHSLTLNYSFSAEKGIGLNFLFFKNKTLKFSNNMNLSVTISQNHVKNYTEGQSALATANSDKTDVSIKPQISYNFSSRINGGLTGEYTRSQDNQRKQGMIIKALKLWAELRF